MIMAVKHFEHVEGPRKRSVLVLALPVVGDGTITLKEINVSPEFSQWHAQPPIL